MDSIKENSYCYRYPHAAVTADCVVFGFDGKRLFLLLVCRGGEPFKGAWALPGGFLDVENDRDIEECARRELEEETNARDIFLRQFHVFSDIGRDPRERVITVAFLALVRKDDCEIREGSDAARAGWFPVDELPPLAFDHAKIVAAARQRLQELLRISPIAFRLLDNQFVMSELQTLYELINDTKYDRRNFAKKMIATGMLSLCGETGGSAHSRRPHLYRFEEGKYNCYLKETDRRKFLFDF